jgi:hypothetical protein
VVVKEAVEPKLLTIAAEKAFCRFPYYSKQIKIYEDGGNKRFLIKLSVCSITIFLFPRLKARRYTK